VSIKAYKNVTANEPFFMGHFPGLPVMPGVLILEALAQAGGVAILSGSDLPLNDKIFLFTGMNKVRFRRPVLPGDRLVLEVGDIRNKLSLWKMSGVASVDGEVVAEGELSAAMVDRESM
jgi:3-hydroxyacyl-[acyl-carrier-protein] dehydratase